MKIFLIIVLFFVIYLVVRPVMRAAFRVKKKRRKRPVRKGRGKIIIAIPVVFAAVFFAITVFAPGLKETGIFGKNVADVDTEAKYVYLINADTGEVLYDKNSGERTAPASTAKILSAIVAEKYCRIDEDVTAGDEVRLVADDASRAQVYLGDELNIGQLMTAMLLPSGNDAAYVIAAYVGRKISGSDDTNTAVSAFTAEMNSVAAELGAEDSNFVTPDGYDADGQYTTAKDMAAIATEFIKHDALMETVGQYKKSDVWTGGKEVTYYNTNLLIDPKGEYYMENVTGIKTGTSDMAGACLIASAQIDGQTYICALMGGSEMGRFKDARTLFKNI